ncbi:hypothetical protein ACIGB6_02950 [Paeniglutamicibacter gangotriensis]|uniref:hypothetical protein n=1 Tax=Paeniglutamicibacter gangotriensis TaxID=254787 RepID=UPI0037C79E4A
MFNEVGFRNDPMSAYAKSLGGCAIKSHKYSCLIAILISGLFLSGCSDASGLQALERPATSDDVLPDGVDLSPIKLDKVLLVAETNGTKYFIGQGTDEITTCLVTFVVDDPTDWVSGCTSGALPTDELVETSGPIGKSSKLVSDGYDTTELESSGWTKIHDNILISGS